MIYHSTRMGMNPVRNWSHDLNVATNSFKYVKLGGGLGQGWHFGAVPHLIYAAVTGRFVSTRWHRSHHERNDDAAAAADLDAPHPRGA